MHMIVLDTSVSHRLASRWKVIFFSETFVKSLHETMDFGEFCKLFTFEFSNKLSMPYRNCHKMIFLSWVWILIEDYLPIFQSVNESIFCILRITEGTIFSPHYSISNLVMIFLSCSYSWHNSCLYYSPFPACSNFICWSATAQASIIGASLPVITCGIPEKFCPILWSVILSCG